MCEEDIMNQEETYKAYIGAYYGVEGMDEYPLKEYVLHDLEKYILNFIETNEKKLDYTSLAHFVREKVSFKTKLQDCLIVLPKIDVSMELLFLIKEKIRLIQEEEY